MPARSATRSTTTAATWLAAANPTVLPEALISRRTSGFRNDGRRCRRNRSPRPARWRTIAGHSTAALAATPSVVPRPSTHSVRPSASACSSAVGLASSTSENEGRARNMATTTRLLTMGAKATAAKAPRACSTAVMRLIRP